MFNARFHAFYRGPLRQFDHLLWGCICGDINIPHRVTHQVIAHRTPHNIGLVARIAQKCQGRLRGAIGKPICGYDRGLVHVIRSARDFNIRAVAPQM